jgi:hypothetical protein
MNHELADHICLIAAPIFAALLAPHVTYSATVSVETLGVLRRYAIEQALALRRDVLAT